MRTAHGGHRRTLSRTGRRVLPLAVPAIVTLLCTTAWAAHSTAVPTGSGQAASSTAPAKKHRKAGKHARHASKPRGAKPTKQSPNQRQAKHHTSKHTKRQAKRHTQRHTVAWRDPSKLTIPEGDGSPILSIAAQYLGRPYQFGSEGDAFDCSGLVRTVFANMGVELPHSAREISTFGDRVGRDDLEPGDLVFFHTTSRHYATHVGIYLGEDKFIHAASRGGQVQVDSLSETYYAQHYFCARRIET